MADCRCGSEFCSICHPELETADEVISLRMDDDTIDSLLTIYVEETLSKESCAAYRDSLDAGASAMEAVSHAIVNEMVVRALIDKIEREKFADALNNNNKDENDDRTEDTR